MMRSVDMQIWPWFMKAPKAAAFDRLVEIGVVEHDERRLAAELQQHRLQMARRDFGDEPPDARRAGEIDAANGRMGDQRLDDSWRRRPAHC